MFRLGTIIRSVSRPFLSSCCQHPNRVVSFLSTYSGGIRQPGITPSRVIPGTFLLVFIWPLRKLFRNDKETSDSVTVELFNKAQEAIRCTDFRRADRLLHDLLKHLHTSYSNGILNARQYADHRLRVYSELANVQLASRNLHDAERVLKQIIRESYQEFAVPLDDAMVLELSLKLAQIYAQLGRLDDADNGFTYCVNRIDERLGHPVEDPKELQNLQALCGLCHDAYAEFLHKQGSLEQALQHARSALDQAHQLYPDNHPNCLNLCLTNAVILAGMRRVVEAHNFIDRVVDACSNNPDSTEQAVCLAHALYQRLVLLLLGDYAQDQAKQLFETLESLLNSIKPRAAEVKEELDRIKSDYGL